MVKARLSDLTIRADSAEPTAVQIARYLRQQIVSGRLPPQSRLPTSRELAATWRVGITSVQKAMAQLYAAGLLDRQQRRGTFVRASTTDIAVTVGAQLSEETALYPRALLKSLRDEMAERGWHCLVYDGLNDSSTDNTGRRSLAYRRFLSDAHDGHFRGVFEVCLQPRRSDEIAGITDLPRVRLGQIVRYSDVMNDYRLFGRDAVNWAADSGCRTLFCLGVEPQSDMHRGIHETAAARGLPAPTCTMIAGFNKPRMDQAVYAQMLALVDGWAAGGAWPDLLLVTDDIAMRAVALALLGRQVPVPGRLRVLTHANAGTEILYGIPVVRYEFSPAENARVAADLVWKTLCGEALPALPLLLGGTIREP